MRLPPKKKKFLILVIRNIFSLRFSIVCFFLFIAFILIGKLYESTTYSFAAFATTAPRHEVENHSLPTFIYIPSLELGLPVKEASITNGVWPTYTDSVSHVASSSSPGENDNVVIYGRNTAEQFGLLTSLTKGDEIIVSLKNGDSYSYTVTDLKIVLPSETGLIRATQKDTLTLYTPYGLASLKRFVVRASIK